MCFNKSCLLIDLVLETVKTGSTVYPEKSDLSKQYAASDQGLHKFCSFQTNQQVKTQFCFSFYMYVLHKVTFAVYVANCTGIARLSFVWNKFNAHFHKCNPKMSTTVQNKYEHCKEFYW